MANERSTAARYGVAIGAIAAAFVLESLPERLGERRALFLLNGAIVLAAWYGGRGPAALALLLAAAMAAYYVVPPYRSFALGPGDAAELGLFLVEGCVVAALTVALTSSLGPRAEASARRCRRDDEQLRKLNKAHRALSVTAEALVRSEDERALLEEVCRAIVEVAGYRMCWVGRAEQDENRTVRPIARAGYDEGYVDQAEVSWSDTERGRGPVGTAIRTGRPVVPQDVVDDEAFAPWRTEALAHGYASVIALPLRSAARSSAR